MYIPPSFREDRIELLASCMREHPLATLVVNGPEGLVANHIPMLFEPEPGPHGVLHGHIARANPLADIGNNLDALAIFHGEQTYISPSWYPSKQENGRVVPTWNYVVVHAHGKLHTYSDPDRLHSHVRQLTASQETRFATGWRLEDAPEDYISGLLRAIVGIEFTITRLEGKFKLSQNRNDADRAGAIAGLRASGDARNAAVADQMQERLSSK